MAEASAPVAVAEQEVLPWVVEEEEEEGLLQPREGEDGAVVAEVVAFAGNHYIAARELIVAAAASPSGAARVVVRLGWHAVVAERRHGGDRPERTTHALAQLLPPVSPDAGDVPAETVDDDTEGW